MKKMKIFGIFGRTTKLLIGDLVKCQSQFKLQNEICQAMQSHLILQMNIYQMNKKKKSGWSKMRLRENKTLFLVKQMLYVKFRYIKN